MFIVNEDLSIYATRGDIVFFNVFAKDGDYTYKFQPGDIVRMSVYGKKDAENVVLQKDFPVTEVSESVFIYLEEADTKFDEIISKHKDYWYEVVLNPDTAPQTIIGYDEDGAKVFRLFPESAEFDDDYEPQPEDFPVVDTELDMTSPRPVANSAIARAVTTILDTCERTNAAVAKLHVTPQMYGAIADGVADDTEAFQAAVSSGSPVFVPAGVYVISTVTVVGEIIIEGSGCVITTVGDGFVLCDALAKKTFKSLKFNCNNGTALTVSVPANTSATNTLSIESCTFEAAANSDRYAIKLFGENEANITNCSFFGCNGISIDGSVNPNVASCVFRHAKVGIMYAHSGKIHSDAAYTCGLRVSETTFLGCEIGVKAVETDSLQVNNCMIDYCDNPVILVGQAGALIANTYISSRHDNPAIYACSNNADTGKYGGNGLSAANTEKLTISNCSVLTHVEDYTTSKVSAIVLVGCTHSLISNSHITWFTEDGVKIVDSVHTSLSELHIACDSRMTDRSNVYAVNSYVGGVQEDNGTNHYSAINTELAIYYHYAKIRNVSNANGFTDEARGSVVVSSGKASYEFNISNKGTAVGAVASLSRNDYRVAVNCNGTTITFTFDRELEDNIRINYIVFFTR